jgi:hypothetical protein
MASHESHYYFNHLHIALFSSKKEQLLYVFLTKKYTLKTSRQEPEPGYMGSVVFIFLLFIKYGKCYKFTHNKFLRFYYGFQDKKQKKKFLII